MSSEPVSYITVEEYIARELAAEQKHEYVHGEMVAMAGGSLRHARIAGNIFMAFGRHLPATCGVYTSDARVCVQWGELITYPDVTVLCGPPQLDERLPHTLLNPTLIIEVLSPSTRNYDRGEKSRLFRLLPSLAEYLLVEQEAVEIEHYRRLPNGRWEIETVRDPGAVLTLESVHCDLPVEEIYRGLENLDAPVA